MVFQLVFANNTILFCFFIFFLIIDLYFLIPAVIMKISFAAVELAIFTGISTKKAEAAEIEIHPVTAKAKITKYSVQL